MGTECTNRVFTFQGLQGRRVVAQFDGGRLTSDGGALLLGEVERRVGIVRRLAGCFRDHRDGSRIEHSVLHLLRQRVWGLALGYEDLNDHDELRADPLLAAVVGKTDPGGGERRRRADRGKALAGKSTLNRLEGGAAGGGPGDRYKRIEVDMGAVDRLFVEVFLDSYAAPPLGIVLDLDATDDPVHGTQEGRFFHGYHGHYCYLPLYIFCGKHLLCARLRPSNIDASEGSVEEVERIVGQIRARWPKVSILLRGDSGFAREELMSWCEHRGVDFLFGLARNARLELALEEEMATARQQCHASGQAERVYKDFRYRTLKSWSRQRRVVGKAEHLPQGANPRFVVTSLSPEQMEAAPLYGKLYCARGEMENRIKEQQLCLFADRTSAHLMAVNQLRLYFSAAAYLVLDHFRRLGLAGTALARARCDTIRTKLLKIGAQVRISVRRVLVSLASAYPYEALFAYAYHRLQQARASPD